MVYFAFMKSVIFHLFALQLDFIAKFKECMFKGRISNYKNVFLRFVITVSKVRSICSQRPHSLLIFNLLMLYTVS